MPTKIFVGNIAPGTTSSQLNELFRNYGPITECDVLGQGNYGFVHMTNETDAETAIAALNGHLLNGSEINVERSTKLTQGRGIKGGVRGGRGGVRTGLPRRNTTKLFIGNLKAGVTSEELRTLFEPFGSVVEADVCGGFGFVHMANESEAMEAMSKLNGFNMKGGCINIELSTKETQGRSSEASRNFINRAVAAAIVPSLISAPVVPAINPSVRYETFASAIQRPSLVGFDGTAAYNFEVPALMRSVPTVSVGAMGLGIGSLANTSVAGDMYARDLLHLYTKNAEVFDTYNKEQLIRKSLDLSALTPTVIPAVTLVTDDTFYGAGLMSVALSTAPPSLAPAGALLQQEFLNTRILAAKSLEPTAAIIPPANHLLGGIGYQTYASPVPVCAAPINYASRLPAAAWGGMAPSPQLFTTYE